MSATAPNVVLREPPILWSGRHISGSLNHAEVGSLARARTIAEPDVVAGLLHLVNECVLDREVEPSAFVYLKHLFLKVMSMVVSTEATRVLRVLCFCHKQPGMNQLVQQSFIKLIERSVLEEWLAQANCAEEAEA